MSDVDVDEMSYEERLKYTARLTDSGIELMGGEIIVTEADSSVVEIARECQRLLAAGDKAGFWYLMVGPDNPPDGVQLGEKVKALSQIEHLVLNAAWIPEAGDNIWGVLSDLDDKYYEMRDALNEAGIEFTGDNIFQVYQEYISNNDDILKKSIND